MTDSHEWHDSSPRSTSRPPSFRLWHLALLLGVVIVTGLAFLQPPALLHAGDRVGYAVCHQIPARSFFTQGRPLPLCARCTGTFLGAMLGFAVILVRRRHRGTEIPPIGVLSVLALFFALWAGDGLNSYLTLFEGLPSLYAPSNVLRVSTGMLNGLMLSSLVFPVFAFTVWADGTKTRSVANFRELAVLVLLAGLLIVAVLLEWPPLLYVLSLFSVLGVLGLLLLVNMVIAVLALRRENRAQRWRDLALPAVIAIAAMAMEIGVLTAFRFFVTGTLEGGF